ncbi:Type II secretory pathway component PulK-like protein [Sphingomonas sp. MMS24-J13]|uniref:Type II secretory pathway component PulK-like protein n=1 Tax=Sphingomonas sp. MMS24-J13 TaxID=3238686 RepID=UPI00384F1A41
MTPKPHEEGMALVMVLLLLAVAGAALAIMMSGEDAALQRATMMGNAARARAIARAGELSAITALRRDGDLANDNAAEPWANIADRGSPIAGGRFQLAIGDAQGKLNLNRLVQGDPLTRRRLDIVANALRLPRDTADHIAGFIGVTGPLSDLDQLAAIGLSAPDIARLATMTTALPQGTTINLNATPEPLLALLLDNPVAARGLIARRARTGKLTRDDLALERVALPAGTGFASTLFWVRARATIGGAGQELTSLLLRRPLRAGGAEVVAIGRWRGSAAPAQAPALPD